MNRTPKLRYKDYTDDWEQRKFSDFSQRESAFRASSSEYPSVEYEDVVAEEGRLNKDIRRKETQKTGIAFDGTQVLYGKLRPYLHNWLSPDFTGVAVGDWWVLRPVGMNKEFLYRMLQTQRFDEVANQSSGSKMPRADWNLVSNTEFIIPPTLDEQRSIAETFDYLDTLITLHQRKHNKITAMRKACFEKMFPQCAQTTPAIRLFGYTDIWKKKKIGSIAIEKLTNGIMNCSSAQTTSIRHINVIDMYQPDKIHIDELSFSGYDDAAVKKCNVEYGDIFLTRSSLKPAGIAEPNVLLDKGKYVFDDHLIRLKIDQSLYDPLFVKYLLETDYVKTQFISRAKTTAFTTIGQDDIADCFGLFPPLEEQQQIGGFFNTINKLVFAYKYKLMKLKQLKQAMLHNMFV